MVPSSISNTTYIDIEPEINHAGHHYSTDENQPLLTFSSQIMDLDKQLEDRDFAIRNVQASLFQVGDIYRELGCLVNAQHSCIGIIAFFHNRSY